MSASFQKSQTKRLKEAFWQHLKLANRAFEWLFYSENNNNNNCEASMWAERLVHMVNPPQLWKHSVRRPDSAYGFS